MNKAFATLNQVQGDRKSSVSRACLTKRTTKPKAMSVILSLQSIKPQNLTPKPITENTQISGRRIPAYLLIKQQRKGNTVDKALKNSLNELIENFEKAKILVIGDIILDEYLWGKTNRYSPEAPVPILEVKRKTYLPGGAANVANNIASLGAKVYLAGVIGEDLYCGVISDLLKKHKINSDFVINDPSRPTTVKTRLIAQNNKHLARVDNETDEPVSAEIQKQIYKNLEKVIDEVDLIILSDYVKGVLTGKLVKDIVKLANRHDKTILMDPKGQDFSKYSGVDILVPNMDEALIATKSSRIRPIKEIAADLRKICLADKVIITMSADGAYYYDGIDEIVMESYSTEVYDATGAGDTFVATLGLALAVSGMDYEKSLMLANYAAAVAVKKVGTFAIKPVQIKELVKVAYNNSGANIG